MIKEIRMSKSMTQSELANAVGAKRSAVSMWEIGKSLPRPMMLVKIASVLGCTVDELLSETKFEDAENPAEQS